MACEAPTGSVENRDVFAAGPQGWVHGRSHPGPHAAAGTCAKLKHALFGANSNSYSMCFYHLLYEVRAANCWLISRDRTRHCSSTFRL